MENQTLPTKRDLYHDYLHEMDDLKDAIKDKLRELRRMTHSIQSMESRVLELEETAELYMPKDAKKEESYLPRFITEPSPERQGELQIIDTQWRKYYTGE